MNIKPIKSEPDYTTALRETDQLWEAKPDTLEGDRLELLSILVEAFEREHYPIPPPDPIAARALHGKPRAHPEGSRTVSWQSRASPR